AGLESVGGFGGKAVALAEGELYSGDPDFYKKQLAAYAAATPESVQRALQKWLTRPVYKLTVVPGERDPYQEAATKLPTFAPSYYRAPEAGEAPLAPPSRVAPQAVQGGAGTPATTVDRSKLPPVGQIDDLDFPDVTRATLSNGIQ